MKRRIAQALRGMADKLDPPPPPRPALRTFRLTEPVFSPEQVARIGKQMAEVMRTRPKFNPPVLPSPPPAPPAPRRLR
jgi:hypothetical protein